MVENGNEGTLSGLDILWKGDLASEDDTYYFTDDWALQNEANGGVPVIDDTDGSNSLNLAAVSGALRVSLATGASSWIGGEQAFSLGDNTSINLAITGDGDDTVIGTAQSETLIGMRGQDLLRGFDGDDQLFGGRGDDTIWAGAGDSGRDYIVGGAGDDLLAGGAGDDLLIGGDATARGFLGVDLDAADGLDVIFGGAGNDTIIGVHWVDADEDGVYDLLEEAITSSDRNQLYGGLGDDVVIGGGEADSIGGGKGSDFLLGRDGADIVWGGHDDGNDTLHGDGGSDTLFGSGGNDWLAGSSGMDFLFGGAGGDVLDGGDDADSLFGGAGNDTISGGSGADAFFFAGNHGVDIITDFDPAEDRLFLVNAVTDFSSVASVQAAASDATINSQSGLLIDTGEGHSVFLAGVDVMDLSASNVVL